MKRLTILLSASAIALIAVNSALAADKVIRAKKPKPPVGKQIEKQVAKLNPKQAVPEKARYVTEERLELRLGVSEALMTKLKRTQDLLSSKNRRAVNLEETLAGLTDEFLQRHDPLEKAKRAQQRAEHKNAAACKNSNELPGPLGFTHLAQHMGI